MEPWNDHPVCEVLDYLGLKRNQANYERLDPGIDWGEVDRNIRIPVKVAVCHILDENGKVVMRHGKPLRVEQLRKRSKEFIEWF